MHPDECRSTHLLLLPPSFDHVAAGQSQQFAHDPQRSTPPYPILGTIREEFPKFLIQLSLPLLLLEKFSSKNPLPLENSHEVYYINLPIILLIPQSILTHSHHPSSVNSPSNPSPTESRCSSPRGPLPFSDSGRIVSLGATHWMDAETEQHREHRRSCVIDTVARTGKDPSGPSLTSSLGRGREESSPAGDAGRQGSANQGCFSSPTTSHG